MVSFQCEGCGDVQTKKKLDSHRNHCRAPFTCIDCMTTFHGTDYKAHTSCMTEDQKYQGHLYKEKPTKANKRKSVSILEPTDQNSLVPLKPNEDMQLAEIPPEVPTPPPAVPTNRDSVFDYMVEEPDGTPKIAWTEPKTDRKEGEMAMKNGAPSVFSRSTNQNDYKNDEERQDDENYENRGFSYGTAPVNPRPMDMNGSTLSLDFMTPAAKTSKAKLDKKDKPQFMTHSRTNSGSEKKRKRGQADDQNGVDATMADAPDSIARTVLDTPGVVHSGLTGGLSRMVTSDSDFQFNPSPPSSPDRDRSPAPARGSKHAADPTSPLKRTRRSKDDVNGLGISLKGRAGKLASMVSGAIAPGYSVTSSDGNLIKTRRRASSSEHSSTRAAKDGEKRERKKHKVTRHNGTSSANVRYERPSRRNGNEASPDAGTRRKLKAIEYHNGQHESNSDSDEARRNGSGNQMVVFGAEEERRRRCETFLGQVPSGDRSSNGYSINKILKRWHRENDVNGHDKVDEEKELWRHLRLRTNDRGEIVVFF